MFLFDCAAACVLGACLGFPGTAGREDSRLWATLLNGEATTPSPPPQASLILLKRCKAMSPKLHWIENPISVFPEMKLRGLVPNSYIHVSVSDLYIPRIGLPIWRQQNRHTNPGNI
jgi:hypothetical protein